MSRRKRTTAIDVTGLPDEVAAALRLLVKGLRAEHADPTGTKRYAPTGRVRRDREHLGDTIQAAESVKACADAVSLSAVAALTDDVIAGARIAPDDPRHAAKLAAHRHAAAQAVVHEVQLLTGSTLHAARDRVRIATCMPDRTGTARAQLAHGTTTFERVRTVHAETAHLDPVMAGAITSRVLAPPARHTDPDARVPLSHNGFRARLRRQLALVESADATRDRKHAEALDRRDVTTSPGRDGTAALQLDGDSVVVFTAQQRLTGLAKAARAAGDPRTLAQLRADLAADLLTRGTVPGDAHLGSAPPGRLHVIVGLDTIVPGSECPDVAEVPGLGFLSGAQVRDLATRAGSLWTRLVTDPATGMVIDAANSYQVPAGMARLVRARDHTCRAPGDCAHPAADCDLDHDTPYDHQAGPGENQSGATHPDNLHAVHRGHHNPKTGRLWTSQQHANGAITWQTLTRKVTTTPHDHRRPEDHAPPHVSRAEQTISQDLARHYETDAMPSVLKDLAAHQLAKERPTPHRRARVEKRDGYEIYWHRDGFHVSLPRPAPPPF
ncbi:HNH endonuclease signature motif containing protein [Flexivirga meconopsidis]|uniref:HNH endonuclease signature motif containing protein n=1 Tax=Flexivirga meconopsidis TaxID=2977121 RepID=UPI002240D65B|nr:HNH endonuclease signature motif containing protein [Flexivirga meconopsidis]